MTADQIAAFCLQLPGAREDLKWGSNRVFSVAGNKMFAILDFVDKDGGLAFKVGSELFLGYVDRPGMASARKSARSTSRPRPWSRVACARHTPAWTPATTSTRTSKAARSRRYCWWTNRAW